MEISYAILATNQYLPLGIRLIKLLHRYSQQDFNVVIGTDVEISPFLPDFLLQKIKRIPCNNNTWVDGVAIKHELLLKVSGDYIFFLDADTNIKQEFSLITPAGLVGAEHYMNKRDMATRKAYERNSTSTAYIPYLDSEYTKTYYQGAFFGGDQQSLHNMCRVLVHWKNKDREVGFEPIWNDESYLNKYFYMYPPTTIPITDFPFVVSDKGSIQNIRKAKSPSSDTLNELIKLKYDYIKLVDGFPVSCGLI